MRNNPFPRKYVPLSSNHYSIYKFESGPYKNQQVLQKYQEQEKQNTVRIHKKRVELFTQPIQKVYPCKKQVLQQDSFFVTQYQDITETVQAQKSRFLTGKQKAIFLQIAMHEVIPSSDPDQEIPYSEHIIEHQLIINNFLKITEFRKKLERSVNLLTEPKKVETNRSKLFRK